MDNKTKEALITACKNNSLVIFVGAGVSSLLGVPRWSDLAKKLSEELFKEKIIDFASFQYITEEIKDPRKQISICDNICKEKDLITISFLRKILDSSNTPNNNVYSLLYKINAVFITTNIDLYLDNEVKNYNNKISGTSYKANVINNYNEIRHYQLLNPGDVVHIHGSLINKNSVVLTIKDYFYTYEDNSPLTRFLKDIFRSKTVLFIGYGLEEYEVLDYLINSLSTNKNKEIQHFLLYAKQQQHRDFIKYEKSYFRDIGIEIIEYDISKKGYVALYDKIEELVNILKDYGNKKNYLDFINKISKLDNKRKKTKYDINSIINFLKRNIKFQQYFFNSTKETIYFKKIFENGFFAAKNNPSPIKVKEGYQIPQWHVLPYLENVSQTVREYDDDLIKIILDTTYFKLNGEYIDNYRTWWYFTKILINIPLSKIPKELIAKAIPIWLISKFSTTLQGSDLVKKLLPKFLTESKSLEDIEKTESLIKIILKVKYVKEKNVFGEKEKAKTLVEDYWLEEGFIKQALAKTIGEKCSSKPIIELMNNLKEIIRRNSPTRRQKIDIEKDKYLVICDNYETNKYKVVISLIDPTKTPNNEMLYKDEDFIKEKLAEFTFQAKNKNEFVKEYLNKTKSITLLKKEIKESALPENLYFSYSEDYSYIWLKDLSKNIGKSIYSAEHLFSIILRDMVLSKARSNKKEGREIIELLLRDENPQFIFKRIVLFVIAEEWDKYKDYFETILTSKGKLYFNLGQVEAELFYLLSKNILSLQNYKEKIKVIIEKGPDYKPKGKEDEYVNIWKQRWYMRLRQDKEFNKLFEKYKNITKKDIKFEKEEGGWIDFEKSPVSKVDLITWNNKKVVKYIHEYKAKDPMHSPTGEGLQSALKGAVIDNPNKFSNDLDPFLDLNNVSFYSLSSLFDGFRQVWISRKEIDWKNIFTAILKLLDNKAFWQKGREMSNKKFTEGFTWFLSSVTELLQEGCKTDDWSFNEAFHKEAEEIIEKIIINFDDPQPYAAKDQLTHALNSTLGKTIIALIYLGLREARLSDKKKENKESKWNNKLKNNFDYVLKKGIPDAYALLGEYFANLHYVDKKWTEDQIKKIEHIKDDKLFIALFEGYLYINNIYNHLYKLMIPSYQRGLGIDFKERILGERLIQHIATGYLRGFEKFDKGLMQKKYIFNNPHNLEEMISFFWQQRDFINEIKAGEKDEIKKMKIDFKERIIEFWEYTIKIYKDIKNPKEEDQKVLSELSKLAIYCSEIGKKEFDLIDISAQYVTVGFDSSFFIESLNALKDKGENKIESAKYVAQLYILMLEGSKKYKGDLPNYDWKDIEEIIKYLYSLGKDLKELTNRICVLYAESGNLMLRDLYDEQNK